MNYYAVIFDWGGTIGGRQGVPNWVRQLFYDLYRSGYRLGVISNSHRYGDARWLRQQFADMQLSQYIEVVAGSGGMLGISSDLGSAGCHKPDIAIYKRVIEFLGVPYYNCVFVGDAWIEDILTPATLGMGALQVDVNIENYSEKLWKLLQDKPQIRQVITTYQSIHDLAHNWSIRCRLRDLTEPLVVGDRLVIGTKEAAVSGFDLSHTKDDILDTSKMGRQIVTIDLEEVKEW